MKVCIKNLGSILCTMVPGNAGSHAIVGYFCAFCPCCCFVTLSEHTPLCKHKFHAEVATTCNIGPKCAMVKFSGSLGAAVLRFVGYWAAHKAVASSKAAHCDLCSWPPGSSESVPNSAICLICPPSLRSNQLGGFGQPQLQLWLHPCVEERERCKCTDMWGWDQQPSIYLPE